MEGNLYSLFDRKMQKYGMPYNAPNDEIAKRMLISTINAGGTTISEFPEDFSLYKIGKYNDDTGELTTEVKFLANAIEFSKKGETTNANISNTVGQEENTK